VAGVPHQVRTESAAPTTVAAVRTVTDWEVYGDWEDDPARRRTDVYFLLEPP
jgi:hypothetical protein